MKNNWKTKKLEDVATIIMGQSPPSSTYNSKGNGLPFFQGKAEFGELYPKVVKWCTEPKKVAEEGDVLISVRAPVGPTNINPHRSGIGRGLAAVRSLDGMPPKLMMYLIDNSVNKLIIKSTGTTFKAIRSSDLRGLELSIPPKELYSDLSNLLDSLFSKIDAGEEGLRKVQQQLEVYRESLLNSAFSDNWKYNPLQVLIEEGPQNGVYYPQNLYGKGIAILRIDDYQDFYNKPVSQLRIVDAPAKDIEKYKLFENDLIINRVNSMSHIGKSMVVSDKHLPSIFESNMMRIRLKDNVVSEFIDLYLKSPKGRSRLIANAKQAVNQASINQQDVKSTLVPIIDKAEQENVVLKLKRELSVIDAANKLINSQQKGTKNLRQSILKKAFNGELI